MLYIFGAETSVSLGVAPSGVALIVSRAYGFRDFFLVEH